MSCLLLVRLTGRDIDTSEQSVEIHRGNSGIEERSTQRETIAPASQSWATMRFSPRTQESLGGFAGFLQSGGQGRHVH
jgi:hypothetical protein